MGPNSACLYIRFPSEQGCEDVSQFEYDFFQLERAAAGEWMQRSSTGGFWHFPWADLKAAAVAVCYPAFLKKTVFYCVKQRLESYDFCTNKSEHKDLIH